MGMIDMSEGEADYLKYRFKQYLGSVSREIQNRKLKEQKMGMTRKQNIQRLVMMKSYAIGEDYEALDYAISSLKTDEAYQLMYEGGEIFTKDDMVAMLTEISLEADELSPDYDNDTYAAGIYDYDNLVQDKIKKLRGEQGENTN